MNHLNELLDTLLASETCKDAGRPPAHTVRARVTLLSSVSFLIASHLQGKQANIYVGEMRCGKRVVGTELRTHAARVNMILLASLQEQSQSQGV